MRQLRAGLWALAGLQIFVSAWQYLLPRAFYDHFPTVELDPPYNEHLVTDVGGLGLAISAVLVVAAVSLDLKVAAAALVGYLVYAGTHFVFHVTHFDGFSLVEALGVGTGLGIEVVLAALLLYLTRRLQQRRP
ncbi:hypothetical protein [Actinoplanes sp. NPDC023714]|uniref:hypothetical protein n=1 Tax=Actinoplanes sp. NPDC023714 TaxID=3154322 RepID=UPI0033D3242D